jgi:hypothetical protein
LKVFINHFKLKEKNGGIKKMIDWKRKLTSRKFWMALASFVSLLVVALGYSETEASKIAALIMAGASVIAYIIGEGLADSSDIYIDSLKEEEEEE